MKDLIVQIASHEVELGLQIVGYMDYKDVRSLFEAYPQLKKIFKGQNIMEIMDIISNCSEFFGQREDWTKYLLSFTMKSKESFECIKPYFVDFGSSDPNAGRTPMHAALLENDPKKFKVFLDALPKNIINRQEPLDRYNSILHFAVCQHLPSMIEVLLNDPRVDVTLQDVDEDTAYECVLYRHDVEMFCIFRKAARSDIDYDVSVTNDYENGFRDYDEDGYFEPKHARYYWTFETYIWNK